MDNTNTIRRAWHRQVGTPEDRIKCTIRLSGLARGLVECMRLPGRLFRDGCPLGDVIETAIRDFCRNNFHNPPSPILVDPPASPERTDEEEAFLARWSPRRRYQTSLQMSRDAREMLQIRTAHLGIPSVYVIEMAIRHLARDCGLIF